MWWLQTRFILIIYLLCSAKGANILAIFHPPGYSHVHFGYTFLEELANREHTITFITSMLPEKQHKNIKIVKIEFDMKKVEEARAKMFDLSSHGMFKKLLWMDLMGLMLTEMSLNQTNVQNLLKSKESFDAVIIENFMNEAFKGFCFHFQTPCIMFSTIGPTRWTNAQMGNPGPPSYVPDMLVTVPSEMNFLERLYNTAAYTTAELFYHLYTYRKQNEILQKYFPGAPHLDELHYNTSLMLLNSHVSTHPAAPLVPNMIEIGGFHVKPSKKLPEDLQTYLDNSKNGAVFFSLGSNLQSKDLPKEKLEIILKCFASLKQNILWKWESETLPGQPPNVKLGKWLPQQDILAHPNTKLFVTHGGLLSLTETLYHGVPIVGIPIFGDQKMNIANVEYAGYGIGAPYDSLQADTFCHAMKEALNNPKYSENAKQRSKIMHDQTMKPIDKGIFWVEYVIRHNGAPHLRTAALNLNWYQYLLLDVIGFYIVAAWLSLFILIKVIKKLFNRKSSKKQDKDKKKK